MGERREVAFASSPLLIFSAFGRPKPFSTIHRAPVLIQSELPTIIFLNYYGLLHPGGAVDPSATGEKKKARRIGKNTRSFAGINYTST